MPCAYQQNQATQTRGYAIGKKHRVYHREIKSISSVSERTSRDYYCEIYHKNLQTSDIQKQIQSSQFSVSNIREVNNRERVTVFDARQNKIVVTLPVKPRGDYAILDFRI